MADAVTWDTLRELAAFRSDAGCAFSLYLDLDPSTTPTAADAETRFHSLLGRVEKGFGNGSARTHAEKAALRADFLRIEDWWDHEFERDGAHGIALFTSSADRLWRVLTLAGHVRDSVQLGHELRLVPLLGLAGEGDGTFVVVVNRERGEVYRLRAGRLVEVVDRSEEQPGQHDQGGWSQARFQRHIEKLVADHLKTVGGEIDKRVQRTRGPQLVIVCPEALRSEVESRLSADARESLVGWAHAEAHAGPGELIEIARPLLAHAQAVRTRQVLERWREGCGRSARATAGWEETLRAASDGRVDLLLYDERTLEPADAGEVAVHHTLTYGGGIVLVPAGELGDAEVGALLRF